MQIFLLKNMFFNIKKLPDLYLRARINNVRARAKGDPIVDEFSNKKRTSEMEILFLLPN